MQGKKYPRWFIKRLPYYRNPNFVAFTLYILTGPQMKPSEENLVDTYFAGLEGFPVELHDLENPVTISTAIIELGLR